MADCIFTRIPDPTYGINDIAPAIAWWHTHNCSPGANGCKEARIAELEACIREMHAAVPGGTHCDPQAIADELRAIARRSGVKV